MSFRREKFVAKGGPNGGDGGAGGDVWVVASNRLNTLYHLHFNREWKAERGEHGMGSNCSGRAGHDETIELPVGSVVRDVETGMVLVDLTEEGQRALVAKGGRGGQGNQHFASATRQSPRFAQPGETGEERRLNIQLKLIADVGIVGFPNAGKSTLISVISAARPKIADYPFTTLHPNLGVVRVAPEKSFVVADIPGLIEGAAEGAGLGHQFLRHLQRTRLLLHVIDLAPLDPEADAARDARAILAELRKYDPELYEKPRWLVLNKIDMIPEDEREACVAAFVKRLRGRGRNAIPIDTKHVFAISALTHDGTERLCQSVYEYLNLARRAEVPEVDVRFDRGDATGAPPAGEPPDGEPAP